MNRRMRGKFLIVLGSVMVLVAGLLTLRNEHQASIAGNNAEALLSAFSHEIQAQEVEAIYDTAVPEELPAGEMPQMTLQGYDLVGIVKIPSIDLELPVFNNWSYDLLQISPCRYSGSVEGEDLILMGHNYKKHFTPIKKTSEGATVEFCSVDGKTHTYKIVATEVLQKTELDALTDSDYPLTLFTCTNGGSARFVMRCVHAPDPAYT